MSKKNAIKPVAAVVGAALVGTLSAVSIASAAENPFGASAMQGGYMQVAEAAAEGKCGEGKCGGEKTATEGKCGEGKCGSEMKSSAEGKCGEGKCGGEMKSSAEGKCGEGKCGGAK